MIEIKPLASSSKGNAYFVTDGVTQLLLECGISWKEIQRGLNFKTSEIQGCLISHGHLDHCKAARDVMKAGIDIYANPETLAAISPAGEYRHRWYQVNYGQQIHIGTFIVKGFELQHDVPNTGYLLYSTATKEKLAFITDSYYCKYTFSGLNYLLLECNHSYEILDRNVASGYLSVDMKKRLIHSHFSLENVKKFLQANDLSQVKEIHLLHLSEGNSDSERFRREVQEITGKPVYVADA